MRREAGNYTGSLIYTFMSWLLEIAATLPGIYCKGLLPDWRFLHLGCVADVNLVGYVEISRSGVSKISGYGGVNEGKSCCERSNTLTLAVIKYNGHSRHTVRMT